MILVPACTIVSLVLAVLGVATNFTSLLYVATGLSCLAVALPIAMAMRMSWQRPHRVIVASRIAAPPQSVAFAAAT